LGFALVVHPHHGALEHLDDAAELVARRDDHRRALGLLGDQAYIGAAPSHPSLSDNGEYCVAPLSLPPSHVRVVQQHAHGLEVVERRGDVNGSGSVHVDGIDVGAVLEQQPCEAQFDSVRCAYY